MSVPKDNRAVLSIIILFALSLRLYGINFSVPQPDDYITVQAAMYFGPAHVEPTGYGLYALHNWPGLTLVYIQIVLFTLYFMLGWVSGVFPDLESFGALYLADPSSFYLIGRIMSVFFGVATIWVLYHMGKKLYNEKVGLMAALFLSASFIHSFHSQFIRPDVPAIFFILLVIMCCLAILKDRDTKYYIFAGIFAGLATATKFTSVIVVIPILVTHYLAEYNNPLNDEDNLMRKKWIPASMIFFGLLVSTGGLILSTLDLNTIRFASHEEVNQQAIVFLNFLMNATVVLGILFVMAGILSVFSRNVRNIILNPLINKKLLYSMAVVPLSFLIFDPIFFIDLKNQVRILLTDPNFSGKNSLWIGVDSLGFFGNAWWYIKGSLSWGLGLHFEIMAALGFLLALYRKRKEDLTIIIFPVLYFLVISNGHFKWERYVITLMPFVALYAAFFLYILAEKIGSVRLSQTSMNRVLASVAIAFVIPCTINIIRYDYLLTQKDTRDMAKEWIESNIPQGSKIGQDAYTAALSGEAYQITKKFSLSDEQFEYYLNNGYNYIIVSDTQYKRYFHEPAKYESNIKFYRRLFEEAELIKEFVPRSDLWPEPGERFAKYHIHISPTVRVYKIKKTI